MSRALFWPLSLVVLVALAVLHVVTGSVDLTPSEVWAALTLRPTEPLHAQIVTGLRLPRALVALTAGAMLGTAGAILQIITRNPLAEPGLTGVSSGAVLAIVLALLSGAGSADGGVTLALWGIGGGMAAGLLTHVLALSRGRTHVLRLILMGVLVSAVLSALTTVALLGARETEIHRILRWTVGSTNGRVWLHVRMILPWAVIGLFLAGLTLRPLNALHLGEETATGLGLRVECARLWLLFVASVLTAGAVAVVGAIGLVGLIGPRMAHAILGQDARRLVPGAAILGAGLLLTADIGARTIEIGWLLAFAGWTDAVGAGLPVGAVTALFGVPVFLWLLWRADRSG